MEYFHAKAKLIHCFVFKGKIRVRENWTHFSDEHENWQCSLADEMLTCKRRKNNEHIFHWWHISNINFRIIFWNDEKVFKYLRWKHSCKWIVLLLMKKLIPSRFHPPIKLLSSHHLQLIYSYKKCLYFKTYRIVKLK